MKPVRLFWPVVRLPLLAVCLALLAGVALWRDRVGEFYAWLMAPPPDEFSWAEDWPQGAVAAAGPEQDSHFRPRRVLDKFPPIVEPPVMSADEAARMLNPTELVLGVEVQGQARAYPINMLTGPQREIINDQLGGRAIAATW